MSDVAVALAKIGYTAIIDEIYSAINEARKAPHKNCKHAEALRTAVNLTYRVLFLCLYYLHRPTAANPAGEKAWSFMVSCENRCPGALLEYRLQQLAPGKIRCHARVGKRRSDMIVLMSLENFARLDRVKGKYGSVNSLKNGDDVVSGGLQYGDITKHLVERRSKLLPLSYKHATTLTGDITWSWIEEQIPQLQVKQCLSFPNRRWTFDIWGPYIKVVGEEFARIMERDNNDHYGAGREARRSALRERTHIPAYKLGNLTMFGDDFGRLAPLPIMARYTELNEVEIQSKKAMEEALEHARNGTGMIVLPRIDHSLFPSRWGLQVKDFKGKE